MTTAGAPKTAGAAIDAGIAIDTAGHLAADLSCIKCAYNLRTLHRDAACPECGTAVGRTIEGNRLRYCDPDWLRTIWHGLNAMAIGLAAAVGLIVVTLAFNFQTVVLNAVLMAAMIVLIALGVLRAATHDPARLDPEPWLGPRRLARVGVIAGFAVFVLWLWLIAIDFWWSVFAGSPPVSVPLFTAAGLAALGLIMLLIHATHLARRLPNRRLAWLTVFANSLFTFCLVGLATLELILEYAWVGGWEPLWYVLSAVEASLGDDLGIGLLISGALIAILFVWYWLALRRAAEHAKQTWASKSTTAQ